MSSNRRQPSSPSPASATSQAQSFSLSPSTADGADRDDASITPLTLATSLTPLSVAAGTGSQPLSIPGRAPNAARGGAGGNGHGYGGHVAMRRSSSGSQSSIELPMSISPLDFNHVGGRPPSFGAAASAAAALNDGAQPVTHHQNIKSTTAHQRRPQQHHSRGGRSAFSSSASFANGGASEVRFVTASAILSRTGAMYPFHRSSKTSGGHGAGGDSLITPTRSTSAGGRRGSSARRRSLSTQDGSISHDENRANGTHEKLREDEINDDQESDSERGSSSSLSDSSGSEDDSLRPPLLRRGSTRAPSTRRKPTSNGSALEAFSALLLGAEAAGKVSSLSSTRNVSSAFGDRRTTPGLGAAVADAARNMLSTVSSSAGGAPTEGIARQWGKQLDWIQMQGAERLGLRLRMPAARKTSAGANGNGISGVSTGRAASGAGLGDTIAERRARRWFTDTLRASLKSLADRQRSYLVDEGPDEEGRPLVRVGTKRSAPSFQMSRAPSRMPPPPAAAATQQRVEDDPFSLDALSPSAQPPSEPSLRRAQSETVTVRARPVPGEGGPGFGAQEAGRMFGRGSAILAPNGVELPEAPPSPVGMPGAWLGAHKWRSRPGDGFEEGALLLPPPLLDDRSNDPRTFEGQWAPC